MIDAPPLGRRLDPLVGGDLMEHRTMPQRRPRPRRVPQGDRIHATARTAPSGPSAGCTSLRRTPGYLRRHRGGSRLRGCAGGGMLTSIAMKRCCEQTGTTTSTAVRKDPFARLRNAAPVSCAARFVGPPQEP